MASGYYYSDEPRNDDGGGSYPMLPVDRGQNTMSPPPKLAERLSSRPRLSATASHVVDLPPPYELYQQFPKLDFGRASSAHDGSDYRERARAGNNARSTRTTCQAISFNTGGNGSGGSGSAPQTAGTPPNGSKYSQSSLVSPPYGKWDQQHSQQQRVMVFSTLQEKGQPHSISPVGQSSDSVQVHSGSKPQSAGNPPGSANDDSFTLSGNQYTQFTPPSSGRGINDENTDDYRRLRSDRQSSSILIQQAPPPLPTHRLMREGSGSVRGMQSPSMSTHQLASSVQSGQSVRSGRDLMSPRLDGPTFVDPEGNLLGGPQRALAPSRKAGSFSSVGGQSDEQQQAQYRGTPSSRSKSFSEANAASGVRRDDGSSLEGSSRRGSFQTSPSLQRRESFSGAGRTFDGEGCRTVFSRLSSLGVSFGFGSPTSTGERSLNRGGGARTPRYGESGGTTPRALSFQRGRVVGSGGFGTVFQAILSDGTLAAVKELKQETSNLKAIDREVSTMSNLPPHPNCVRYFGSRHSKNHYYIIMEYISGGSIYSLRQSVGRFRESVFQRYAYMVLLGLEHLHNNGIIHRDIKGANVLLDERGCAKIVDFGCCKDLNQGTQTFGAGGTPLWMAPEVCRGDTATVKSDVWAFGCLCLEMTNDTGLPWSFPSTMTLQGVAYALASAQNPPPIPENLSAVAQDFIACCLRLDPDERLDVPQLLNHPFFDLDYMYDSDSEDDLIVSREPSARESAVKRLMKNVNENGEGFALNTMNQSDTTQAQAKPPPSVPSKGSGAGRKAISFSTAGNSSNCTRTKGGGGGGGAGSPQQTVNMGFQLEAIDDDSKDDEDSDEDNGIGGATLRPVERCATGGADAESYAEDAEYMATVTDIITRARKSNSSHGVGPNPRSSTATGGHATTLTNTTGTTSPSNPRHGHTSQLDFSSATSSTFTSDHSSSAPSRSSSASSSPHLAGTKRDAKEGHLAAGEAFRSKKGRLAGGPPDRGSDITKVAGDRRVFQRVGDSPEPESLSPREPEGGTKPKSSRVDDRNTDSSNYSRTSAAGAKAFQRRSTFPLGNSATGGGTSNAYPSSAKGDCVPRAETKSDGLAPGGPSRVKAADPPGPAYPSSDGVSMARSSANNTRPVRPAPSGPSYSSTIAGSPRSGPTREERRSAGHSSGDAAFIFSSGSQGHVAPVKRTRPANTVNGSTSAHASAKADITAPPRQEKPRMWTSGGRDSVSKEFTAALREVKDIISFTHTDERQRSSKKVSSEDKAEKRKGGPSKWFSK